MGEASFDPTMALTLRKGTRRYRFEIHTSATLPGWPYWIDDEDGQRFGVMESADGVLQLKATLEARVRELERDGWTRG
jgi:hypothetical protein